MASKICSSCKIEKPITSFSKDKTRKDGHCYVCRECLSKKGKKYYQNNAERIKARRALSKDKRSAYDKEYYRKNRDRKRAKGREYRRKNKEKISECHREWRKNNKEWLREYWKLHQRERKKDPMYKMKCTVRGMLLDAFRRKGLVKPAPSEEILGCSVGVFQDYLKQTWEKNYGTEWDGEPFHIDHIVPLATAKTEEDVVRLCHYTNLQMLTPKDNLNKRDQYHEFIKKL